MTIKRFVKAAALGISLVVFIAVTAWLLVDDATLISALERQLETVTDTRISHQGGARITRSLSPAIELDRLVIEDHGARFRIEISSFLVQISLSKLLLSQLDIPRLLLGDIRITFLHGGSGKTTAQRFTPLRLKPVLHHVRMGKADPCYRQVG